ncbi:hypothetical protein [Cellvibrio sp. pealriver]|uniref:hypothetical protein n=1 Tax=Cellvibrio sp. pealriver TaxID=1622269 RepID=UPI00069FB1DB|nr:hypothetical protein [Cellvibrio sp. pealriver]
MNNRIASLFLFATVMASMPSWADDLGIKVILEGEVSPGVYGRVELGNDSHPDIYYPQPVVVAKNSRYASYKPVYLHVPPGHAKNWGKHCHKYHACERPVYFIKSMEYDDNYQREHQHDHEHKKSDRKGSKEKGNGKKHDRH